MKCDKTDLIFCVVLTQFSRCNFISKNGFFQRWEEIINFAHFFSKKGRFKVLPTLTISWVNQMGTIGNTDGL